MIPPTSRSTFWSITGQTPLTFRCIWTVVSSGPVSRSPGRHDFLSTATGLRTVDPSRGISQDEGSLLLRSCGWDVATFHEAFGERFGQVFSGLDGC